MKKIFLGTILLSLLSFGGVASTVGKNMTQQNCAEKKEAVDMALDSMVLMQTIVKGYVYHSSEESNTVLNQRMKRSLKQLDQLVARTKTFQSDDADIQMCLKILPVSVSEIKELIKQKTTPGNDQLIVDLATVITEAVMGIAKGMQHNQVVYKAGTKPLNLRLSAL